MALSASRRASCWRNVGINAQGAPAEKPAGLHWGPAPAVFPMGARMAVVSGDPSKAGLFTVQLAMPSGYKIAPHFHPTMRPSKSRRAHCSSAWEISSTHRRRRR